MSLDISLMELSPHEVFSQNITHNLGEMAEKAGIYSCLWHPEETRIVTAADLAERLVPALADMKARPEYFKQFDAPNGWGKYEHFIPWLEKLIEACNEHPKANIEVSI